MLSDSTDVSRVVIFIEIVSRMVVVTKGWGRRKLRVFVYGRRVSVLEGEKVLEIGYIPVWIYSAHVVVLGVGL